MQTPTDLDRLERLLARLATICAALVLVVISASAYLRLSQAGLGCVDWPACYGRANASSAQAESSISMRDWVRLVHRVAAMAVSVLVLLIAYLSWIRRPVQWTRRWLAIVVLGLTLFLSVLGRWTTGAKIPAVTLGNLLGGFAMLGALWWLRLSVTPAGITFPRFAGALKRWATLGLVLTITQIASGALVSAKFAALSCGTFPDCNGTWWPGRLAISDVNPFRELATVADGSVDVPAGAASLHIMHRYGAVLVLGYLGSLGAQIVAQGGAYRTMGLTLLGLLGLQVGLGMLSVVMALPLAVVVAHNAGAAALMLAVLTVLQRLSGR